MFCFMDKVWKKYWTCKGCGMWKHIQDVHAYFKMVEVGDFSWRFQYILVMVDGSVGFATHFTLGRFTSMGYIMSLSVFGNLRFCFWLLITSVETVLQDAWTVLPVVQLLGFLGGDRLSVKEVGSKRDTYLTATNGEQWWSNRTWLTARNVSTTALTNRLCDVPGARNATTSTTTSTTVATTTSASSLTPLCYSSSWHGKMGGECSVKMAFQC